MAEELRRLIRLSVSTAPPAEETAALTAQLAAVADRLEAHRPEVPLPRFMGPAGGRCRQWPPFQAPCPSTSSWAGSTPWPCRSDSSSIRRGHWATPPSPRAYEGAPGCVHGGALAATFDIVFTGANAIAEATGPTVRLDVRYRRPTLIDEEALFEAWVTEVTARRVFSRGASSKGGR
jgi:hypothetical protein